MPTPNNRENRPHRATSRYLTSLLIIVVLMMFIATSASATPSGPVGIGAVNVSSIWLDGPDQAAPGEEISYNIAADASGLFGAQLELSFDTAVLQVVGTQVTPGSCPAPDFVVTNSVDNSAGTISYAATALAPTLPCDGGVVASFQFQVSPEAAAGSTQVHFESVILADSNGSEIPAAPVDQNLEIVVTTAAFSGTPTTGPVPLTVHFSDLSSGDYDSCTWDFGDGSGNNLCENQGHIYNTPGSYTVELTISGSSGSDSESKVDYIVVWQEHLLYLPVILSGE